MQFFESTVLIYKTVYENFFWQFVIDNPQQVLKIEKYLLIQYGRMKNDISMNSTVLSFEYIAAQKVAIVLEISLKTSN